MRTRNQTTLVITRLGHEHRGVVVAPGTRITLSRAAANFARAAGAGYLQHSPPAAEPVDVSDASAPPPPDFAGESAGDDDGGEDADEPDSTFPVTVETMDGEPGEGVCLGPGYYEDGTTTDPIERHRPRIQPEAI